MVGMNLSFFIFGIVFVVYTAILFLISWLTTRKGTSSSFFLGDRKAPWPIVAYGMVGASISGVTFISVPGNVMAQNFYYLPLVIGFGLGYLVVARLLLPLYYRMQLTSIYSYLGDRFGERSHWTGTVFFMISRVLGAAVRILVVVIVLFAFIPKSFFSGLPDVLLVGIITLSFLTLLYLYTYRGGVKTIIWTDVLQTTFMLLAVFMTIFYIARELDWSLWQMFKVVANAENPNIPGTSYSSILDWNWGSGTNVLKQLFAGVFISTAMTGLDQSMMQMSLACKNLKSSQRNIYSTAITITIVNLFFLLLGAILSIYVEQTGGMQAMGITSTDEIFPTIASGYLGVGIGIFFLIGLISASYPSAGAALTSLTTSFCIDFLKFNSRNDLSETRRKHFRMKVQALFAVLFFFIILALFLWNNDAVINLIYKLASYTYGPLLGIFFFGILTKYTVKDKFTPYVAIASPIICFLINYFGKMYLGFDLGFTLLIVNAAITFFGMWMIRVRAY